MNSPFRSDVVFTERPKDKNRMLLLAHKGRTQGQLALHALGCLLTSLRYLEV